MGNNSLIEIFREEASDLLVEAEMIFLNLSSDSNFLQDIEKVSRIYHNIKGSAKTAGLAEGSTFSHLIEDLIINIANSQSNFDDESKRILVEANDALKDLLLSDKPNVGPINSIAEKIQQRLGKEIESIIEEKLENKTEAHASTDRQEKSDTSKKTPNDNFLKVPMKRIDSLINLLNELRIISSKCGVQLIEEESPVITGFRGIEKIISRLHNSAINLRLVGVQPLVNRMQKVFFESLQIAEKKAEFVSSGGDIEIDKAILDGLIDPLSHMIRNAVDHGLENDEMDRMFNGKEEVGKVSLKAYKSGGQFTIEVSDDGRGIDPEAIFLKAVEKKIVSANDNLSNDEKLRLIFSPGFSTKEAVTELSGRGVGMDVVNTMLENMGGLCDIQSNSWARNSFHNIDTNEFKYCWSHDSRIGRKKSMSF